MKIAIFNNNDSVYHLNNTTGKLLSLRNSTVLIFYKGVYQNSFVELSKSEVETTGNFDIVESMHGYFIYNSEILFRASVKRTISSCGGYTCYKNNFFLTTNTNSYFFGNSRPVKNNEIELYRKYKLLYYDFVYLKDSFNISKIHECIIIDNNIYVKIFPENIIVKASDVIKYVKQKSWSIKRLTFNGNMQEYYNSYDKCSNSLKLSVYSDSYKCRFKIGQRVKQGTIIEIKLLKLRKTIGYIDLIVRVLTKEGKIEKFGINKIKK